MKKLSFLTLATALTSFAFAGELSEIPGNGPDQPIEVQVVDGSVPATFIQISNEGFQGNLWENPQCGPYQGGDVWLMAIAPESGKLGIKGGKSAFGLTRMQVYTGVPGALEHLACGSPSTLNKVPDMELTGLQAGEAVYVRVWDAGNDQVGQFSLSFFDAEFDRDWSTDIHPVVDVTRPTIEAEINDDMIARVAPSVQVYPNPVYMADPFGNVRLSAAFEIETRVKIVISNFNGEPVRVIRRYIPADRNIEIDLNGLRGGVYFLSATSRGMSASTRLLIR